METHNIDSIIKKAIDDSGNFYDHEANKAKERIWKQVQFKKQNPPRLILLRSLVAACILLFVSTSVIYISFIRTKETIKTLVELNSTLMNNSTANVQNSKPVKEPLTATNYNSPDTIFIEKKAIVTNPIIITKHIIDTVYIRQIVYVEKEMTSELLASVKNSIIADSSYQKNEKNYETEILIRNNELPKKEKGRRIQIKFGGNKNQLKNGILAFTARL
jgi:hypothetical protein